VSKKRLTYSKRRNGLQKENLKHLLRGRERWRRKGVGGREEEKRGRGAFTREKDNELSPKERKKKSFRKLGSLFDKRSKGDIGRPAR